jgi:hypothetical protein
VDPVPDPLLLCSIKDGQNGNPYSVVSIDIVFQFCIVSYVSMLFHISFENTQRKRYIWEVSTSFVTLQARLQGILEDYTPVFCSQRSLSLTDFSVRTMAIEVARVTMAFIIGLYTIAPCIHVARIVMYLYWGILSP